MSSDLRLSEPLKEPGRRICPGTARLCLRGGLGLCRMGLSALRDRSARRGPASWKSRAHCHAPLCTRPYSQSSIRRLSGSPWNPGMTRAKRRCSPARGKRGVISNYCNGQQRQSSNQRRLTRADLWRWQVNHGLLRREIDGGLLCSSSICVSRKTAASELKSSSNHRPQKNQGPSTGSQPEPVCRPCIPEQAGSWVSSS